MVIFGTGAVNPRYPEAELVPPTVLINPELEPLGQALVQGWEGCLSVPGMRGLVPRWLVMLGRTAGGATVALIQGLIIIVFCALIGLRSQHLSQLPLLTVFMVMMAVMFTALGTSIACVVADFQAFPLVMNFLVMPLFFLSGALFPLDQVPPAMKVIASFNPLAYGIDGLRGSLSGTWHFGTGTDLAVLAVVTLVLLVIGSRLFNRIEA